MIPKDYYIGLDIGTDSVGWAVTDAEYHIPKAHGKALWGIRLFDEAQTAADRRVFRTARRRLERRRQRLEWLQQIFAEEIGKVDPAFYLRLKESKFCEEDKDGQLTGRFSAFADENFTDKEYHTLYPTIYHLRYALLTQPGPFDVRLVYLALHHIMKNRGHFLIDGELNTQNYSFATTFKALTEYLENENDILLSCTDETAAEDLLKTRSVTRTDKAKQLKKLLQAQYTDGTDATPVADMIAELLSGKEAKLTAVFTPPEDDTKKYSISFEKDFAEIEAEYEPLMGEDFELIRLARGIYDWAVFADVMKGNNYLSAAKVESYKKHKADLVLCKAVIRQYLPGEYRSFFHSCKDNYYNYASYVGKDSPNMHCTNYDDFRKCLSALLKKMPQEDSRVQQITAELERGIFLPLQVTKDNSVIPQQLHQAELRQILQNAAVYLPFLNQADTDGKTPAEKILAIFTFRIPYYVGPLNVASPNAWLQRTDEKLTPWNFAENVDIAASAEKFITRMTAKCSYTGEDVLPKDSLLYSEFMLHNELNNLSLNGSRIPPQAKQQLIDAIFLHKEKVSAAKLKDALKALGALQAGDVLTGIDGDPKASLRSWIAFRRIRQTLPDADVEEIIRRVVLFGQDRALLGKWLQENYGKKLPQEDLDYICHLVKLTGWGGLSRAFLTEIRCQMPQLGECSIIEALRKTNCNLMELLSNQYGFTDALKQYLKQKNDKKLTADEYLAQSYLSPAVKRGVKQSLAIVDELRKIMGTEPKRIFIEMARGEEKEKKRTVSRKDQLTELYKKCGEQADLLALLEQKTDAELRRDKLYLYFTQLGKCMYSGETIRIEDLFNDNLYDIDHIYPQSRIKDDSISNRVLVKKGLNMAKRNEPIPAEIQKKMRPMWEALRKKGLIDAKKLERLNHRGATFSREELEGFVARQLVETRQSSKAVAGLLQQLYTDAEIVYVKAGNVSAFRQQADEPIAPGAERTYDFVKCREVNDLHHAKDAYLNVVVGNVYHTKFTADPRRFFALPDARNYSMNRVFDYPVQRGGITAWQPGENGTMATVRAVMRKNNVLFTRMATTYNGGLFDQTVMPKGKGQAQQKASDNRLTIEKFGGYNKIAGSYFALVESTEKKKRVRSIQPVFAMYHSLFEHDPVTYCTQVLGLEQPRVVVSCIRFNSLLQKDGCSMHLSGRTGSNLSMKNGVQLVLDPYWMFYCKQLFKYLERCKQAKKELELTAYDVINREQNVKLYDCLLQKLQSTIYANMFGAAAKNISDKRDIFISLSVKEQGDVLQQILHLFACDASSADLSHLGSGKTGFLRPAQRLDEKNNHLVLINQSVTGVFENRIDLCEVQP